MSKSSIVIMCEIHINSYVSMLSNFEYKIIRSRRRSIALVIGDDGGLIVRAPRLMPKPAIDAFVASKADWIVSRQRQVAIERTKCPLIKVETGGKISYLGEELTIIKGAGARIKVNGAELYVPENCSEDTLRNWLKKQARTVIMERVGIYAEIMRVTPGAISLSSAKTRWGSCSSRNDLRFSWRLVMCPVPIIDYVVVHELSHITHKDHSAAFWARVGSVFPNYKAARKWLKEHRLLMSVI